MHLCPKDFLNKVQTPDPARSKALRQALSKPAYIKTARHHSRIRLWMVPDGLFPAEWMHLGMPQLPSSVLPRC